MSTLDKEQLVAKNSLGSSLQNVTGQGIDFPFRFTKSKQVGVIATSNAGERIKDSIHLILATGIGERLFNPEFGSRLPELVFEPSDEVLYRLLVIYTANALSRWEKRIKVESINLVKNLDGDYSRIGIEITYTIRNSHIRGSYVYPFVREGMSTDDLYTGTESHRMRNQGQVVV